MTTKGEWVLVIEDFPVVRQVTTAILASAGMRVAGASHVLAAQSVIAAAAQPPRAAVVDLRLPDGSGEEVARELRAHHQGIALVFISGDIFVDEDALTATNDAVFLRKPFSGAELIAAVRSALHRSRPP